MRPRPCRYSCVKSTFPSAVSGRGAALRPQSRRVPPPPPAPPGGVESPSTAPESAPSGSEAVVILIDPDEAVRKVHEGLVELGLVARPTKDVSAKRVAASPRGRDPFPAEPDGEPWKPTTKL